MTSLVRSLIPVALILAACGAPTPGPVAASPTVAPIATDETPSPKPVPLRLPAKVMLADGTIPIVTSFKLEPRPVDESIEATARGGVVRYLEGLDQWRRSIDKNWFPVQGEFGDAVRRGLEASATPGVERKLDIAALTVERYLVKPWGNAGLAEVRVTIVDRVVSGPGTEQRETGRLRLVGEPLSVVDGWDGSAQRWFNGPETMAEEVLRRDIVPALEGYLRLETWDPTTALETGLGPGTNTYSGRRHAHLLSLDRTSIVARWFDNVRAEIQRFETFAELRHGLATVKLTGQLVTVDPSGAQTVEPLARTVVVLFGSWIPEVIDEETGGVWMALDQRLVTLQERDRSFG